MRAQLGLAGAGSRAAGDRDQRTGRILVIAGAAVAAVAAVAYLAAVATHPMDAMLKGFDLHVYVDGGGHEALHHPAGLYSWIYDGHPSIMFTYPPFAALGFAAGLALPFTGLMALVAVISVAALVTTISIAFRELGWRGSARLGATLLLAGLMLWSEPVQRGLFLGQVELTLMGLVVWDLCQNDQRPWKGAVTGIAAGIKVIPLLYILYLVATKRFRQAAVAAGAFAVTLAVGFAALPSASVYYWIDGNVFHAGRTGFVGDQQNQSLRGIMTRLIGSVASAASPWLVVAVLAGAAGLAAAALLHRRGYTFAGLMVTSLTTLLVSPISWDHHWVWIAPGLALIADAAIRAGRSGATGLRNAWWALAAAVLVIYAGWPDFWSARAGLLQGALINYAPASSFASGEDPAFKEYHWHGLQLIAGNAYILGGIALFAVVLAVAWRLARAARTGVNASASPSQ